MKRAAISAGLLSALVLAASGEDWAQWGGHPSRNMYSTEKGLPDRFEPGKMKKGSLAYEIQNTFCDAAVHRSDGSIVITSKS